MAITNSQEYTIAQIIKNNYPYTFRTMRDMDYDVLFQHGTEVIYYTEYLLENYYNLFYELCYRYIHINNTHHILSAAYEGVILESIQEDKYYLRVTIQGYNDKVLMFNINPNKFSVYFTTNEKESSQQVFFNSSKLKTTITESIKWAFTQ